MSQTQSLSLGSSFLCGLLITLGDPKAIMFYVSFLPAFIDLAMLTIVDIAGILMLAAIAVGGSKIAYAYTAATAKVWIRQPQTTIWLHRLAGTIMILTGIYIMASA